MKMAVKLTYSQNIRRKICIQIKYQFTIKRMCCNALNVSIDCASNGCVSFAAACMYVLVLSFAYTAIAFN